MTEMVAFLDSYVYRIFIPGQYKSCNALNQKVDLCYLLALLDDVFLLLYINGPQQFADPCDKTLLLELEEVDRLINALMNLHCQLDP